jgi:hypothetical protein
MANMEGLSGTILRKGEAVLKGLVVVDQRVRKLTKKESESAANRCKWSLLSYRLLWCRGWASVERCGLVAGFDI